MILWFPSPAACTHFWRLDHALLGSENTLPLCDSKHSRKLAGFWCFWRFLPWWRCSFPWLLSLFFLFLFLCTVAFFRDPDRLAPADPNLIVAAADGTVSEIVEMDENEVLKAKTRRVGIFLSIFDVHTNRAPIDGRIVYRQHRDGLCLDARRRRLLGEERIDDVGF